MSKILRSLNSKIAVPLERCSDSEKPSGMINSTKNVTAGTSVLKSYRIPRKTSSPKTTEVSEASNSDNRAKQISPGAPATFVNDNAPTKLSFEEAMIACSALSESPKPKDVRVQCEEKEKKKRGRKRKVEEAASDSKQSKPESKKTARKPAKKPSTKEKDQAKTSTNGNKKLSVKTTVPSPKSDGPLPDLVPSAPACDPVPAVQNEEITELNAFNTPSCSSSEPVSENIPQNEEHNLTAEGPEPSSCDEMPDIPNPEPELYEPEDSKESIAAAIAAYSASLNKDPVPKEAEIVGIEVLKFVKTEKESDDEEEQLQNIIAEVALQVQDLERDLTHKTRMLAQVQTRKADIGEEKEKLKSENKSKLDEEESAVKNVQESKIRLDEANERLAIKQNEELVMMLELRMKQVAAIQLELQLTEAKNDTVLAEKVAAAKKCAENLEKNVKQFQNELENSRQFVSDAQLKLTEAEQHQTQVAAFLSALFHSRMTALDSELDVITREETQLLAAVESLKCSLETLRKKKKKSVAKILRLDYLKKLEKLHAGEEDEVVRERFGISTSTPPVTQNREDAAAAEEESRALIPCTEAVTPATVPPLPSIPYPPPAVFQPTRKPTQYGSPWMQDQHYRSWDNGQLLSQQPYVMCSPLPQYRAIGQQLPGPYVRYSTPPPPQQAWGKCVMCAAPAARSCRICNAPICAWPECSVLHMRQSSHFTASPV